MKKTLWILLFLPMLSYGQGHGPQLKKIYDAELSSGHTYENLRYCMELSMSHRVPTLKSVL